MRGLDVCHLVQRNAWREVWVVPGCCWALGACGRGVRRWERGLKADPGSSKPTVVIHLTHFCSNLERIESYYHQETVSQSCFRLDHLVDSTSAARSPDRSVLISIAANVKVMPGLSSKAVPFSYITRQLFYSPDCPLSACWTSCLSGMIPSSLQPAPLCPPELLQRCDCC